MSGYETRSSLDSCSDEGGSALFAQFFCFILSSARTHSHQLVLWDVICFNALEQMGRSNCCG